MTICLLFTIAAIDDMEIHGMDVVTAFLKGILSKEEAVYMKAPDSAGLPPGTIVKLR